jgi:hypothetical protein
LLNVACETLCIKHGNLMGRLTAIGKPIGPPWS